MIGYDGAPWRRGCLNALDNAVRPHQREMRSRDGNCFARALTSTLSRRTLSPMNPILSYRCYRKLLSAQFAARCAKDPAYSQRAFARDLKLSPGHANGLWA